MPVSVGGVAVLTQKQLEIIQDTVRVAIEGSKLATKEELYELAELLTKQHEETKQLLQQAAKNEG